MENSDNPVQEPVEVEEPALEAEDTGEESAPQEIELDEDGNPIETEPEDDGEDVEYEGKQYKVPKELKDALLRQADYTRKTQEVAEQRRQVESYVQEQQQTLQLRAATVDAQAYLVSIDQQLAQYNSLDWQALSREDPAQAQALWFQKSQLAEQRQGVAYQISQAQQAIMQTQQQDAERRKQECIAVLQREIPGFSPQMIKAVDDFAQRELGIPQEILSQVDHPSIIKALNEFYMLKMGQKQKSQPVKQPIKPVTTVKARSASSATDPMKLSSEQWAAKRNAELAKRNKR